MCTRDWDCPGAQRCEVLRGGGPANGSCACSSAFGFVDGSDATGECSVPGERTGVQRAVLIVSLTWASVLAAWTLVELCRAFACRRRRLTPKLATMCFCLVSEVFFLAARSLELQDMESPAAFVNSSFFFTGYKVSPNRDASFLLIRLSWILLMHGLLSVSISSVQVLYIRKPTAAGGGQTDATNRARFTARLLVGVRLLYTVWALVFLLLSPQNLSFLWVAQLPFLAFLYLLFLILVIRTRSMIVGVLRHQTKESTNASKLLERRAAGATASGGITVRTEPPNHGLRNALKRLFSASLLMLFLLSVFVVCVTLQGYFWMQGLVNPNPDSSSAPVRSSVWVFEAAQYVALALVTVLMRFVCGYHTLVFCCLERRVRAARGGGTAGDPTGAGGEHRSKGFYIPSKNTPRGDVSKDHSKLTMDTSSKGAGGGLSKLDVSKDMGSSKDLTPRATVPHVSLFELDKTPPTSSALVRASGSARGDEAFQSGDGHTPIPTIIRRSGSNQELSVIRSGEEL